PRPENGTLGRSELPGRPPRELSARGGAGGGPSSPNPLTRVTGEETMSVYSLLNRLFRHRDSRRRVPVRPSPPRRRSDPLHLEALEDRQLLSTFTVTNPFDDPPGTPIGQLTSGTLRWALQQAYDSAGTDTIVFSPGLPTIYLKSTLEVNSPVLIDGFTQSGA